MQIPRHQQLLEAKLRHWDPERVQSAAKLVTQLMAQPGWAEIQLLIGQAKEGHERAMLQGATLAHADYARLAGVLQGLTTLEDAPKAIFAVAQAIDEKNREASERQTAAGGA